MNLKLIVAISVIVAVPMCAQAQKPSAAKVTKADAQKVVKIIRDDKAKMQTYCDIVKLGDQADDAAQKKDEKKVDELNQKMEELAKKLGPEYNAMLAALQDTDMASEDGQEIGRTLETLDSLCPK
jgi:peptidoglycan hydrolase CwlO-like protein